MANKFKSEVESNGFKLVLDFNSMTNFEDMTGVGFFDAIKLLHEEKLRFGHMRALVFCAMQKHHKDATLDQAGDLLSEDMTLAVSLIAAAIPDEVKNSGNARKPTKKVG